MVQAEVKKAVIRADASSLIGAGHVMRCLTIASALYDEGYEIVFIMSNIDGHMASQVENRGFEVFMINDKLPVETVKCEFSAWNEDLQKNDADQCVRIIQKLGNINVLVMDHYCLDVHWEKVFSKYAEQIIVIDDLANRVHACDILLDQNYFSNMNERYIGLVSEKCKLLIGPKYSLLDNKFQSVVRKTRDFSKGIKRILMFFGGADSDNITMKALSGLVPVLPTDIIVDVIVGASNKHAPELFAFYKGHDSVNIFQGIDNMQDYIKKADIAFGAGGVSTWERCISGLPTFTISIAENQVQTSCDLDEMKAIIYMGDAADINEQSFNDAWAWAIENSNILKKISINAMAIMGVQTANSRLALLECLK